MSLLAVRDVSAGYGEADILHGVSIAVEAGEIVTIIGPNGAGKSTLMRAIFGLLNIKRGEVELRGTNVVGEKPSALVRRGMAYVPQSENVFPSLTVEENVAMGGASHKHIAADAIEQIFELFPALKARRSTRARGLSGGERQMLAIGRALLAKPTLLMLDEPSAGLSPLMSDMVFDKVAEIGRSGVACLLVEQNARAALSISQRGYVLVAGQNRLDGRGQDLLANQDIGRLFLGG
jgi:ABC-type branched-subunit amino acid transport system ATPase component